MTKMTKREMYEAIKAVLTDEAQIAFIDHEIELLVKKNSYKSTKPTATQVANEGIKGTILNGMVSGKAYTITEMQKSFDGLGELSNQRVSALVRQLVDEGKVVKTIDKRKSYFSLA